MTSLLEMHQKTTSCKEYDRMLRSVAPMCDYFNVNQFYYAKVQAFSDQIYYSVLATHLKWQEFLFNNIKMIATWPILRNPDKLNSQIILEKNTANSQFNDVLEIAWNTFNINFTVGIQKKITAGIELYGFGVNFRHPKAEEHLLNELPLLEKFITYFHEENKKLVDLADDHQVEISSFLGASSADRQVENYQFSKKRIRLLVCLGFGAILLLTPREIDVLRFIANGFPANYIALQLHLSSRTVENHIANIKSKLGCDSKVDLIKKAQEIVVVLNQA